MVGFIPGLAVLEVAPVLMKVLLYSFRFLVIELVLSCVEGYQLLLEKFRDFAARHLVLFVVQFSFILHVY
jgi:hypothetical protein